MNDIASRADHIRDRLVTHWTEVMTVSVSTIPPEKWPHCVEDFGPTARFGVGWPMPPILDPDDIFTIPFCAEVIADVTADLTDAELTQYLMGIEQITSLVFVNMLTKGMESAAALQKAEDQMYDAFPEGMMAMALTQAAYLDRELRFGEDF